MQPSFQLSWLRDSDCYLQTTFSIISCRVPWERFQTSRPKELMAVRPVRQVFCKIFARDFGASLSLYNMKTVRAGSH